MFLTVKVYWVKPQVDDRLRLAAREPKGFLQAVLQLLGVKILGTSQTKNGLN